MQTIWFVDTSIMCHLLPVPGRDGERDRVSREMKEKEQGGATFILPVSTIIETGNHVAQIKDGTVRRTTAEKFSQLLTLVAQERAPWRLHEFSWGRQTLGALINGAFHRAAAGRQLRQQPWLRRPVHPRRT